MTNQSIPMHASTVNQKIATTLYVIRTQPLIIAWLLFVLTEKMKIMMDAEILMSLRIVFGMEFARMIFVCIIRRIRSLKLFAPRNSVKLTSTLHNVKVQSKNAYGKLNIAPGTYATIDTSTSTLSIVIPPGAPKKSTKTNSAAKLELLQ